MGYALHLGIRYGWVFRIALGIFWLSSFGAATPSFGTEYLGASQIRDLLTGAVLSTKTRGNEPYEVEFKEGGLIEGGIEKTYMTVRDTGRWWIAQPRTMCVQWKKFGGGRKICRLLQWDGETVKFSSINGSHSRIWTIKGPGKAADKARREDSSGSTSRGAITSALEIRSLITGLAVSTKSQSGHPMTIKFAANGTISSTIMASEGPQHDDGRWWIYDSGFLCFQWQRFGRGRHHCVSLKRVGNRIELYRPDGERARAPFVIAHQRPLPASGIDDPTADIHFGTYHALVIGNNDYRVFQDLRTAARDADAVADMLQRDYGFRVMLLRNATRADVIGALAKMRATLKFDDSLLIYYAGHGVLDNVAEQGYWLPVDAERGDPTNWISTHDVTTMLRVIRAKHILVVADSCYSGTLARQASNPIGMTLGQEEWVKRMVTRRARTALVSGGLEPVEDGIGPHSVFATAFLNALSRNKSVLAGYALYDAIKRPVVLNADQTPQYSDIRRAGHDGGDFLFVRRPK